jgi:hypothetical protein
VECQRKVQMSACQQSSNVRFWFLFFNDVVVNGT